MVSRQQSVVESKSSYGVATLRVVVARFEKPRYSYIGFLRSVTQSISVNNVFK
mgnify:CR=1 FL=1